VVEHWTPTKFLPLETTVAVPLADKGASLCSCFEQRNHTTAASDHRNDRRRDDADSFNGYEAEVVWALVPTGSTTDDAPAPRRSNVAADAREKKIATRRSWRPSCEGPGEDFSCGVDREFCYLFASPPRLRRAFPISRNSGREIDE